MSKPIAYEDANPVVKSTTDVRSGDVIAYPARPRPGATEHAPRDFIRVTRVAQGSIFGHREHPEDWERDIEFQVYPAQVADGVFLIHEAGAPVAAEAPSTPKDPSPRMRGKRACDE
jgi:hypothetical protein